MPPKKVEKVEEVTPDAAEVPDVPKSGFGKFEYVNQTLYIGEWKLLDDGTKVKHGNGKIIFPGTINAHGNQVGGEEYDGSWHEDKMHGHGTYKFTSGNIYSGHWDLGAMHGHGKMEYADGSSYDGNWKQNLMHGAGTFIDTDKINWTGIFVDGTFDSKIQKKLQAEQVVKEQIHKFESSCRVFFSKFSDAFAKSDKKTFKDNMGPMLGSSDTCIDYLNLTLPKFEDRPPEKWNELVKAMSEDNTLKAHALSVKDDATLIQPEQILVDQLRNKPGGQLVEFTSSVAKMVLC